MTLAVQVGHSKGVAGTLKNIAGAPCRAFLRLNNSSRWPLPAKTTGRFLLKNTLHSAEGLPNDIIQAMKLGKIPWVRAFPVFINRIKRGEVAIQIDHRKFSSKRGDRIIEIFSDIFHSEVWYLVYSQEGDAFMITIGRLDNRLSYVQLDYLPDARTATKIDPRQAAGVYATIAQGVFPL